MSAGRVNIFAVLDVIKFLLAVVIFLLVLQFGHNLAQSVSSAKQTATNTNRIVKSQADILAAIKQVTQDTRTTQEKKTNTILYLLQLPRVDRTDAMIANCKKVSDSSTPNNATQTSSVRANTVHSSSSSKTRTKPEKPQPNTSQQSDNSQSVQVLGIPVCVPLLNLCVKESGQ